MKIQRFYFTKPVRAAMARKGIQTLTELSELSKVSQGTLSKFFSRRSASRGTAEKICDVLDLDPVKIQDHTRALHQASLFDDSPTAEHAEHFLQEFLNAQKVNKANQRRRA